MLAERVNYYKALERDARRPLGQSAHPDDCPKLLLHGVGFALPPRDARIVPRFGPDGVRLAACGGADWPETNELRQAIAALRRDRLCPACGQPIGATLEIDLRRGARALELAFAVAATALRAQYDLSDEQLADLLAVCGESAPQWFEQIVRYCYGLPTERPPRAVPVEQARDRKGGLLRRLLGR
jgi:hypothetical protein